MTTKLGEPPAGFYDDPTAENTNGTPYAEYRAEQAERQKQAVSEASAPAFRIWTAAEIWKPLEPPDYLIDRLFVRGSLGLIVAYGASQKTWALLDALVAVAVGGDWLQRFAAKQGQALLVDFESGDYELRRRLHRLASGRGLETPIDGLGFVSMPSVSLASEEFYKAIRPLAEQYAFIGIDSLAAGSGGIDENDARFAVSLQRLKAIASEAGCVIVLLHHARKSPAGGNGETDQREMVRGSSAIFNACDVVLQLVRGEEGAFVCTQSKARGGKAVEPFVVRVDDVSESGTVIAASDVEEREESAQGDRFDQVKARIVRLLSHERDLRSASEIHRRLRGTKKTNMEAVKELEERGIVVKREGAFRLASEGAR